MVMSHTVCVSRVIFLFCAAVTELRLPEEDLTGTLPETACDILYLFMSSVS